MTPRSRRRFLQQSLAGATLGSLLPDQLVAQGVAPGSRQATGVLVGEVSDTSAMVRLRLTAQAGHNAAGRVFPRGKAIRLDANANLDELRGACPGAAGRVRLRYGTSAELTGAQATDWTEVTEKSDFSHQVTLQGLTPDTVYHYSAETTGPRGKPAHTALRGRFRTAPAADQYRDVLFTVVTCTMFKDLDHADGFHLFPAMAQLQPQFYLHSGDNVYYDSDDIVANTTALARHHWHRMHGQPRQVAFHLQTPGYWLKDDHDTWRDDCWPTMNAKAMLPLTFAEGCRIFREVVPMGQRTYRTYRWGRGLQIWMVEGRDFRTPNSMADGPNKTIWGAEQKRWLFESLRASTADFKVLISPTPIVGPDRPKKNDNHSNEGFRHEGDEIRAWFRKHLPEQRFCVICGDRHWQYHSVHPRTGLHEFSCGPGSDVHAGGTPGLNRDYHRFHRVRGGFLSVNFQRTGKRSRLVMKHHDVMGKVMYEHTFPG